MTIDKQHNVGESVAAGRYRTICKNQGTAWALAWKIRKSSHITLRVKERDKQDATTNT